MANWRWDVFCQNTIDNELVAGCFASGRDQTYLQWMLQAWGWTVSVSLAALLLALVVGSIIGTIRTLPDSPWLVRFGNAWVELFRNIPLLVQIFLWYFVLPKLMPPMKSFPPFILVAFSRRRVSPNSCARACWRCRAGNATPAWRWA